MQRVWPQKDKKKKKSPQFFKIIHFPKILPSIFLVSFCSKCVFYKQLKNIFRIFCLLIVFLFLKDIFTEYRISRWAGFTFSTFKYVIPLSFGLCRLLKLSQISLCCSFGGNAPFLLWLFLWFSLYLWSLVVWLICLCVPGWSLLSFLDMWVDILTSFEKFLSITFPNTGCTITSWDSFSLPSGTLITSILNHTLFFPAAIRFGYFL